MRKSNASSDPSDLSRWVFPLWCKPCTKTPVGVCGVEDFLMYKEGDPQCQCEQFFQGKSIQPVPKVFAQQHAHPVQGKENKSVDPVTSSLCQ